MEAHFSQKKTKHKKGNCDFLSHNSDFFSQLWVYISQLWEIYFFLELWDLNSQLRVKVRIARYKRTIVFFLRTVWYKLTIDVIKSE